MNGRGFVDAGKIDDRYTESLRLVNYLAEHPDTGHLADYDGDVPIDTAMDIGAAFYAEARESRHTGDLPALDSPLQVEMLDRFEPGDPKDAATVTYGPDYDSLDEDARTQTVRSDAFAGLEDAGVIDRHIPFDATLGGGFSSFDEDVLYLLTDLGRAYHEAVRRAGAAVA